MKVATLALVFLGLTAALTPAPAHADSVLYSSGPSSYANVALPINYGGVYSDSFTLAQNATITGFTFVTWLDSGDTLNSFYWSIGSSFFAGGPVPANVTKTFIETNSFEKDVYTETVSFSGQSISAGTYYLTLQSAVTADSGPAWWDVNNGSSTSETYDINYNPMPGPSETFAIVGNNDASATPEPSGFLLLGTGLLGLFALIFRRRMATLRIA